MPLVYGDVKRCACCAPGDNDLQKGRGVVHLLLRELHQFFQHGRDLNVYGSRYEVTNAWGETAVAVAQPHQFPFVVVVVAAAAATPAVGIPALLAKSRPTVAPRFVQNSKRKRSASTSRPSPL